MITSIIILTYNKLDYTKLCIDSIRKFTKLGTFEIIVVDNNSTDGTVEWLLEQQDIRTILNDRNLGFPKGCNQGIEISIGDSILLLNNDTIATPRWLENLTKCLYSDESIGAVGPITNYCSNYQTIQVDYESNDELIEFANKHNVLDKKLWEDRLKLVGFCMLIKKEVISNIGLLDEIFTPGNYEDDDYSFRIRKAGYRLILCKDTYIHHFGSTTFKENSQAYYEVLKINEKKFFKKWGFEPNYITDIRKDITAFIKNNNQSMPNILHIGCAGGGTLLDIKNVIPKANLFGLEKWSNVIVNTEYFAMINIDDLEKINKYKRESFDYIITPVQIKNIGDLIKTIDCSKAFLKETGIFVIIITEELILQIELLEKYLNDTFKKYIYKLYESEYGVFIYMKNVEKDEVYNLLSEIDNEENINKSVDLIIKILKEDETRLQDIISNIEFNITHKIEILNLLGVKCYENQIIDCVIPLFQKVLEYDKNNKDANINLAFILESVGEYNLAFDYIKNIKDIDNDTIEIVTRLGKMTYSEDKGLNNILDIEQNDVKFTGERLVINKEVKEKYGDVLEEHITRYELACEYVNGKRVLDAACGAGYGTKMLKEAGAKEVVGVDISEESLQNAKKDYEGNNITFNYGDVNKLAYKDNSFDVVVSFETIEHICDGADWIKESSRVLREEGIFIVSTPNRYVTNPGTYLEEQPLNLYHKYEYNMGEFVGELLKEYDILELYGQTFVSDSDLLLFKLARQYRKLDTNYLPKSGSSEHGHSLISISNIKNAQPMYLVAVCRKKQSRICKYNKSTIEIYGDNMVEESFINYNSNLSKRFNSFGENSFIDKGYKINRVESVFIGSNTFIKDNCWLNICVDDNRNEPKIIIKDGCQIGSRFIISVANKAVIERNVIIGPNVYIADCGHNYENVGIPIMEQGVTSNINTVTIGEGSWLGINTVIVGNVHVGKGCVIGANSFVNNDIPDYCIAVGNPCKVVKVFDIKSGKWVKVKDNYELQKHLEEREDLLNYVVPITNLKSMQVEVSSSCNLKCPQCFNKIEGHKDGFISKKLWNERISPYLKQLNEIYLVGIGEPLLNNDFFYFVEDSIRNNVKVCTTSNLQLVNAKIAEKIVTSGIEELSFSCDAATEEIYNKIRINGSLKKLEESLSLINEYKKKYNSLTPRLILNFGAMKCNIEELPQVIELAHRHKIDNVIAYHNIIYSENMEDQSLHNYQALSDELFLKSKKIADSLSVTMLMPGLFSNPIKYCSKGIYCGYPFAHLWIYSDGRIGPCCMDFPERYILGDLNISSIEEAWNSESILKLRRDLVTHPSEICHYCVSHGKMDISNSKYFFRFKKNKQDTQVKI